MSKMKRESVKEIKGTYMKMIIMIDHGIQTMIGEKKTKGSEKSVGSMGCSSGWDQNIIGIRVYKES